jgi:uncharacterized protein
MQRWTERLGALGKVVKFDYLYMREGRRAPDRMPKLLVAHAEALADARKEHSGSVFLIGKSMGSRVGCHLSLELDKPVNGLICMGYPLVGMGKKAPLRDQVLLDLSTPILFVQGTRDKLCPLDKLEAVRNKMTATSELRVVDTGDHSLQVTKTYLKAEGLTQDDVDESILASIRTFVDAR